MTTDSAARTFVRSLHWRYALFAVCFLAFVAAMGVAEKMGLPRSWIGVSFMAVTIGTYAGIGFWCRTTDELEYYVAGRRVPAMYNGMATAADWMSAASFMGTAGVLYLQGFAGLAYVLGWTGGYCLVALLLAPYLRRLGLYTLPDFLGHRYGGLMPRLLGALATIAVSFVYMVAQLYGVGLVASHVFGLAFDVGIYIGLGGVLMCSFLGGMRAITWTQVAQYIVLIIAFLLPVIWLSVKVSGQPMPLAAYRAPLQQLAERERELLNDPREQQVIEMLKHRAAQAQAKLANVPAAMVADAAVLSLQIQQLKAEGAPLSRIHQAERQLRALPTSEAQARVRFEREREQASARAVPLGGLPPQALPFARGDPHGDAPQQKAFDAERRNFLALVFCLMLGTAAMPHVLTRYYTTASVSETRRSVAWSLLFISILYLAAPALAVLVKFNVFDSVVGLPFDHLPSWINRWSKVDPSLVSVEDINGDGILQLAELRLAGDVIVLAAPEIGGLPQVVTFLVAAGGLAAALSTADGLLLTISNAITHDIYFRVVNPAAAPLHRVMASKLLLLLVALLAAMVASLRLADILLFVTAAFSIAASALFPALVMGVFWRRANRWGVNCGMLAGLGVCLFYMAINTSWLRQMLGLAVVSADSRWWDIAPASAGVFGVPVGMAVLLGVSLMTSRAGMPMHVDVSNEIRGWKVRRHV